MMKPQVTLYSKPGCHLCEEMKREMARADCNEAYDLKELNIETDAELFTRYRHDIPVLNINGLDVFQHRLLAREFKAYLTDLLTPVKAE
jgi:glutaredoxin